MPTSGSLPVVSGNSAGVVDVTGQEHVDALHKVQGFLQTLPTRVLKNSREESRVRSGDVALVVFILFIYLFKNGQYINLKTHIYIYFFLSHAYSSRDRSSVEHTVSKKIKNESTA